MSYDLDDIIEHYGVKGMKWGVRKGPDRVSARKKNGTNTYTDMDGNTWTTTGNMNRAKEKELRAKSEKTAKADKKPEKKKLIVGLTENSRSKDRRPSNIAPGLGGIAIHLAARHSENKKLNNAISKSMNTPIKDIDKKSLKYARSAMKAYTDVRMAFEGEDKEYNITE